MDLAVLVGVQPGAVRLLGFLLGFPLAAKGSALRALAAGVRMDAGVAVGRLDLELTSLGRPGPVADGLCPRAGLAVPLAGGLRLLHRPLQDRSNHVR